MGKKLLPPGILSDLTPTHVLVYSKDVLIKKPSLTPQHPRGKRTSVELFSQASQRRLLFVARNSGHMVKSQLCLTYHFALPESGEEVKKQLHRFLTRLRKKYEGISYLWVLEFQERGFPHFHVFTNRNPTDTDFRDWAAIEWNRICGESEKHLRFQGHPSNFIPWNMASGKYLVKEYLAKAAQKTVPEEYHSVGRFWGHSRNMKPVPVVMAPGVEITKNVFKIAVRITSKRRENILKNYVKKNYRRYGISYSLPLLSSVFLALVDYYNGFIGECYQNQSRAMTPG